MNPRRILAISNFYPPHHAGGYELGARDVLDELRARGHHVEVLTSTRGVERAESRDGVHRWLDLEYSMNDASRARRVVYLLERELSSRRAFERACREVRPDLVYAFNLKHVSIAMLFRAEARGLPVHYFASDDWLARWERDLWYRVRRGRKKLDLGRAQFVSAYLKRAALEAGKAVGDAEVIPWGVVLDRSRVRPEGPNRCRLLFAGQLAAHKGLHTVIEALEIVRRRAPELEPHLSLAGRFLDSAYEARIKSTVARLGLESAVTWLGSVPRERLVELAADHDVFVFASVWEEPFSIVLLEAMASGLAVVATATGGSPEILVNYENCLIFPVVDSEACAAGVLELGRDPELFARLGRAARSVIRERYQLSTMVDRVERALGR